MQHPPHILVVEDEPVDFELIQHELQREGIEFTARRVDADDELFHELKEHPPDIVLSDNALANADCATMLRLVRNRCPDTPCIVVTGGMAGTKVAEALAHGADDCILKQRLTDLGPAVRKALRLAEERRRLRLVEAERDQLQRELSVLRGQRQPFGPLVTLCRGCKRIHATDGDWETIEHHFQRRYGLAFHHELCPECVKPC